MRLLLPAATAMLLLLPLTLSGAEKKPSFRTLTNTQHGFRLLVPADWRERNADLKHRRISIFTHGPATEIVVTAIDPDREDIRQWDDIQSWYIKGIGRSMVTIMESKSITLSRDIVARIVLFEFSLRGSRVLQRVLIARYGETLLVIECRAPVRHFSRYASIFDQVMGSVSLIASLPKDDKDKKSSDENNKDTEIKEDKKEDKTAPQPAIEDEKKEEKQDSDQVIDQ